MKTTSKNARLSRVIALFTAVILVIGLMATPAAAATAPDETPSQPISLARGLVITERGEYGLGREFVHVVIDGDLVVTMDVATWRILAGHDPNQRGYLLSYDSVFALWQTQRAVEWVDRNLSMDADGSFSYSITDPHDPEFQFVHLTTSIVGRCPITEVIRTTTGETVSADIVTVTLTVYNPDGTNSDSVIEIAQISVDSGASDVPIDTTTEPLVQ